jgi:hypothetical protein
MDYRNRASTLLFRPACTERSHRLVEDKWMADLVCGHSGFFGLWLFGFWLSPMVARPRPSPGLIHVFGHPRGFAFPSIFGLLYAGTFSYSGLLALARLRAPGKSYWSGFGSHSAYRRLRQDRSRSALAKRPLWVVFLIGLFWIELLLPASGRGTSRPWRAASFIQTDAAAQAGRARYPRGSSGTARMSPIPFTIL